MSTILQINSCANWGSTGRIAEQINQTAQKEGWNAYFAYGDPALACNSTLIRIGNIISRGEALIEARLFDNDGLSSRMATRSLISRIKEISPDIIHIHNLHGYYINYKILFNYCIETNTPVIWTLHDCWSITGHCTHFALDNCLKWKSECNHCQAKRRYPKSLWADSSSRNFLLKKQLLTRIPRLTIVPVSEWLRSIVNDSFLKERNIQVIPNGIDINVFSPKPETTFLRNKYGIGERFVILAAGTTWQSYKGISDFYRLRELLSDDYLIMLVGLSKKQIMSLPKGIIGIPRTSSQDELANLYSMADCVMSLSRLESFGLTPIEGFACGTPAIVYDNTALTELVTDETGFKVPVGDVLALRESVICLNNRGKSSYSDACRRRAVDLYDKNKCFKEYVRLYNSVLGL